MNKIIVSDYANPLACGYIKDGELNLLLDFQSIELVKCHGTLGTNLLDFVWLEEELIEEIFDLLCEKYLFGCTASELMDFVSPIALKNIYLLTYITYAVDLLFDGTVDNRFDADNDISFLDELIDTYTIDDVKMIIIKQIKLDIAEKQKDVQRDIEIFLGDNSLYKDYTPAQRLYLAERKGNNYLSTSFKTSFASLIDVRDMSHEELTEKIKKENIPFFEMFELNTLDDIIRFELVQMINHNCIIRKCKLCGKLFTPKGRIDSLFCSRIMEDEERPCIDIGPSRLQTSGINTNPIRKAYKQAYDRMSSRKRYGTISVKEFQKWQLESGTLRDKCLFGKMRLSEYQAWLDETKS